MYKILIFLIIGFFTVWLVLADNQNNTHINNSLLSSISYKYSKIYNLSDEQIINLNCVDFLKSDMLWASKFEKQYYIHYVNRCIKYKNNKSVNYYIKTLFIDRDDFITFYDYYWEYNDYLESYDYITFEEYLEFNEKYIEADFNIFKKKQSEYKKLLNQMKIIN